MYSHYATYLRSELFFRVNQHFPTTNPNIIAGIILVTVIVFPFTRFEGAWNYRSNFCLGTEAIVMNKAVDYVKSNHTDYKSYRYYFDSNYGAIALDMDYFDTTQMFRTWQVPWDTINPVPKGFVIWDDWYSAFEYKMTLDGLKGDIRLKFIREFKENEPWGATRVVDLFEIMNPPFEKGRVNE